MLPWQPFLAFYIWGAQWRHLKNTTEPSMCGGDAALCEITLTTCLYLQTTQFNSWDGALAQPNNLNAPKSGPSRF